VAGGETFEHKELKRLATVWAIEAGFGLCGREIRVPASNFRADVAACRKPVPGSPHPGETVLFECKQARADLLKDSRPENETRKQLAVLRDRQLELEDLLARHMPSLRHGDSLFPEYDSLDLKGFRHETIRKVRREAETLSRRVFGGTKFDRMVRYRCADFCYLVMAEGLATGYAPPQGWGILVVEEDHLRLDRRPVRLDADPAQRLALLASIAQKGSMGMVPPQPLFRQVPHPARPELHRWVRSRSKDGQVPD
jgi:hypothetical protein